ncbi:hypothetical protein RJ641_030204 [Dillenia turbinata]|uniref:Uncharacterized protein n=1 Tax=Dillenia turbinata TaxID=194707 RepID=A0AAN8VT87_9MAGN
MAHNRSRKFQPEDRLFSLSSVTSPAVDLKTIVPQDEVNKEGKWERGKMILACLHGRALGDKLKSTQLDEMVYLYFYLSEFGPGRPKGGAPANGQGKPKKGRGGPRDAKRIRQSSEQDLDFEDDPDLIY